MDANVYNKRKYVGILSVCSQGKQSQTKPILVPCKPISALTAQFSNFFVVLAAGKDILLFMWNWNSINFGRSTMKNN